METQRDQAAISRATLTGTIVVLGALVVVHVPLLLNDGLFGEDWLLFQLKPGYPTNTDFLLHGAGHPFLYAYSRLANWSGDPIAFMKVLALAGILIGAWNLKNFLQRLDWFSETEAAIFSFVVWSYAGFQDWATKLTAAYVFSMALLCLGLNLLARLARDDRPAVALRLGSLAAIFCSFSLNSLIVAYAIGLCALFFATGADQATDKPGILWRARTFVSRFGDFVAVPIVYWVVINLLFPKVGPYHDYYLMRLPDPAEMLSQLAQFARWGVVNPLSEAASLTRESVKPIILSLIIGGGFVLLVARLDKADHRPQQDVVALTLPLVAGLVVFVLCALPYLSAGLGPNGHFYESRHLILFGVPLGLALVSVLRLLHTAVGRRAALAVAALALSINLCALWDAYFLQEARWLRQSAMIDGLRRGYAEPPAATFDLADGFLNHPGQVYYGITEITGGLHAAWDDRPLFGFTGRNERPTVLQEIDKSMRMDGTAFRNMDLWGPQATIELIPKQPVLSNYRLSVRYYWCLLGLGDARSLIDDIATTTIRVGPIPNLEPRHP
jgi:hypothetical protein